MGRTLVLLTLLAIPGAALAHDFVDTRLNFTLTNENVLVKPGETNPSVPGVRIDRPNRFGILFFENYDTRFSGYENLTHLVLYKRITRKRFEAEASLVFRFLEFSDVTLSSIDDGTYIKLTYYTDKTRTKNNNISLTAFPLSADRLRLGYSYRLSWGGSPIFFKYNPDLPTTAQVPVNSAPAPGARLQYATDRFGIWGGFKTSTLLNRNPQVNELVAIYGVLGGVLVDIVKDHLRFEVNGGYFDRGTNPLFYSTQDVSGGKPYRDFPVFTTGASFQVSAFNGISPSGSLDYALYKNDPTSSTRFFAKPVYKPGFNWLAQAEFTVLATALQNPDRVSSSIIQQAIAGDVNLRAQVGHLRLKADASYRSLEFILLNQPSLVPYQAFPQGSVVRGDFFADIGFDYFFQRKGLTVGATVGIDSPATFTPPTIVNGQGYCPRTGGSTCTSATIVVRGEGDYSILPERDSQGRRVDAVPSFASKFTLREDFLEYFAAILDIYYSYDANQTRLTKDSIGNQIRDFNHPNQLGFNLTLQARF
jgi:hypothetical protein